MGLLSVESVALDRLSPSPANPRKNDDAVEHVAASIRRFGFQQPVVAKRSGEIIAGHTRFKAAKKLGLTEVPVVWFEGSDLEATAYGIADNRTHEFSEWDEPALAKLLDELRREDALDGVGFAEREIDDLLAEVGVGGNPFDEDVAPEPMDAATTRKGDLWLLGRHRLLCGDSASAADVDTLLGGARVQLVNTDPPYNVKVEPRSNNAIAAGLSSFGGTHHQRFDAERNPDAAKATHAKLRAKDRPLMNDFLPAAEFEAMLDAWFGNCARVMDDGACFYIWGGYANCANYPPALKKSGLYFSQAIIWVKGHPVLTRKDYMGNHEWCFYGWKEGAGHKFYGPNNETDVWEIKKVNPQAMVHLTEKPVELAVKAIELSSRPGENVLDLFGGSGSSLMGCEHAGRNAFLMELDPVYADVIVRRFEKATGTTAKLAATGLTFDEVVADRSAS
jgi:DNA modification methylase